jgi:hypothetical protein
MQPSALSRAMASRTTAGSRRTARRARARSEGGRRARLTSFSIRPRNARTTGRRDRATGNFLCGRRSLDLHVICLSDNLFIRLILNPSGSQDAVRQGPPDISAGPANPHGTGFRLPPE